MGHHLFCEVRSPGSCSPVTIRVPNIFTLYYAVSGVSRGLPVKKHLCYIEMAVFARMDILHALKEGVPKTTSRFPCEFIPNIDNCDTIGKLWVSLVLLAGIRRVCFYIRQIYSGS